MRRLNRWQDNQQNWIRQKNFDQNEGFTVNHVIGIPENSSYGPSNIMVKGWKNCLYRNRKDFLGR